MNTLKEGRPGRPYYVHTKRLAMKNFVNASKEIERCIETLTKDTIHDVCIMLDDFWKTYCETTVTFLFFVRWTIHNHAAKSVWAGLDYKLRQKLKLLRFI
jgi:hypothetical protein